MSVEKGDFDAETIPSPSKDSTMIPQIDHKKQRYPCCIVWTPIPILTWIIPFIGHMGIAMSNGVIRDFAGSHYVSEDNMAFGKPTKFWQLDLNQAVGGQAAWDHAVSEASEEYKSRVHNLLLDNCHSHVAKALNLMHYNGSTCWNMVKVGLYSFLFSRYVSFWGIVKTWCPFFIFITTLIVFCLLT